MSIRRFSTWKHPGPRKGIGIYLTPFDVMPVPLCRMKRVRQHPFIKIICAARWKNMRCFCGIHAFADVYHNNAPNFQRSYARRAAFHKDRQAVGMLHGGCRRKGFWRKGENCQFVWSILLLLHGTHGIIRLTSCCVPSDAQFAQKQKITMLFAWARSFLFQKILPRIQSFTGRKEQMFGYGIILPRFFKMCNSEALVKS